ncbi:L-rhamnose mutarotase [Sphingomonas oryzagri]|uniref:L-rhamnose mutarotase n=1 Tax=Sphingomonas oryzagri TaxID=3042314 RepID=A0ABT6MWK6_9SPHN|nr:L-rhamnose mutarotase [Sphingomonas oryzagri]MDH7637257.1 L-rhamnose mutarotase [Sphingomonas oryzagri]
MADRQRHVLLLDLIDDADAIARYEAWHADGALPPAIGRSIRTAGVTAMDIYRAGTRLVMVMDTAEGFDPAAKAAADAADPDVQAWETLMASVQRPIPTAAPGEKWVEAARIFTLAGQP